VHGEDDLLVPAANGRDVAARIRDARLVLVPSASHILLTDQTERVNRRAILEFLREVSAPTR
jgi:pimeloyl-ACP methyl ester carboxylesterase